MDNKTRLKFINMLSKYGFTLQKENEEISLTYFVNMDLRIIIEVCFTLNKYKLIYTNEEMVGILDSGWFDKELFLNEGHFEQTLIQFNESVKVLRNNYEEIDPYGGYME